MVKRTLYYVKVGDQEIGPFYTRKGAEDEAVYRGSRVIERIVAADPNKPPYDKLARLVWESERRGK